MLLNFQYQQVVKRNGGVYDISPKSNELCTNVQVELTIPLAVLGRGMGVKSFKIIQILTESPRAIEHFKCRKLPFDKNSCYYHFSNIQFSAGRICFLILD